MLTEIFAIALGRLRTCVAKFLYLINFVFEHCSSTSFEKSSAIAKTIKTNFEFGDYQKYENIIFQRSAKLMVVAEKVIAVTKSFLPVEQAACESARISKCIYKLCVNAHFRYYTK